MASQGTYDLFIVWFALCLGSGAHLIFIENQSHKTRYTLAWPDQSVL